MADRRAQDVGEASADVRLGRGRSAESAALGLGRSGQGEGGFGRPFFLAASSKEGRRRGTRDGDAAGIILSALERSGTIVSTIIARIAPAATAGRGDAAGSAVEGEIAGDAAPLGGERDGAPEEDDEGGAFPSASSPPALASPSGRLERKTAITANEADRSALEQVTPMTIDFRNAVDQRADARAAPLSFLWVARSLGRCACGGGRPRRRAAGCTR